MVEEGVGKDGGGEHEGTNNNNETQKNQVKGGEGGSTKKVKSCKGCLYYSYTLKSNSRNPLCAGITRSLPQVTRYIVGESEVEAFKDGRSVPDFKYGCVGYSVCSDRKGNSVNMQEDTQTELPVCVVGIEVLVGRRATNADSVPAHTHTREDGHGFPQPRPQKPAHSIGDEFLGRFTRNVSLVATGVAKNMVRVGNHTKESIDDILYPDRRRPK